MEITTTARQLTLFEYEQKPLKELEEIIERGMATFIEVGLALYAIRKGEKYKKAGYVNFNDYIEERWGMSHSYGLRQLNAGYIASEMVPIGTIYPKSESQVRPLTRLGTLEKPRDGWPQPDSWIEAWNDACDLAGKDKDGKNRPPTAKEVDYVVKGMLWQDPGPIPDGEYQVIYADPPWEFDNSGFDQSAAAHYATMPTTKIAVLSTEIPSAVNAVCFMWATNAMLEDALEVMKEWGFDYKTNFVWIKETGPTMGFYTTSRHELLLIGVKGQGMLPISRPISVLTGQVTEHSRKPPEVHTMIESMYSGPYLEMFGRKPYPGWTVWGNENNEFSDNGRK